MSFNLSLTSQSLIARLKGSAYDFYGIATSSPNLVLDFVNNYYRTDGTATTFDDAVTHSRTSNATMVDADGLLKWAPHNLLTYSDDLSLGWASIGTTEIYAADETSPTGFSTKVTITSGDFRQIRQDAGAQVGKKIKFEGLFKAGTHPYVAVSIQSVSASTSARVIINLITGVSIQDASSGVVSTITEYGNGWYLVTAEGVVTNDGAFDVSISPTDITGANITAVGTETFFVSSTSLYRSDLGGMINNPATGNSYVPTTSAAKYLPRVGNHVYNVTKGALVNDLGPELVNPIDFNTGWSTSGAAVAFDNASAYTSAGVANIYKNYFTVGKIYSVTANISFTSSSVTLYNSSSAVNSITSVSNGVTFTKTFVALDTELNIRPSNAGSVTINSVTVKEINPWVNEGLLHESAAGTNLVTYSHDFTNVKWVLENTSVSINSIGPDGKMSAAELVESTLTSTQLIKTTETVTSGVTYVISGYVKAGVGNRYPILRAQNEGSNVWAAFNLTTGTVTDEGTDVTKSFIESVGEGWFRVAIVYTNAGDITGGVSFAISNSATPATGFPSYTGDGTSSILIYGAQLEASSVPTSYIPTAGATATRAAETLTVPIANVPYPVPVEVTGTELITNGTFDTDTTGWTSPRTNSTLSIVGGKLRVTAIAAGAYGVVSSASIETGFTYQASINCVASSGNTLLNFRVGDPQDLQSNSAIAINLVVGESASSVVFTTTPKYVGVIAVASAGGSYFEVDNISVKEINPLAVSIQMDGLMTYADGGLELEVVNYYWQANSSNFLRATVHTGAALVGSRFFAQNAFGVYDTAERPAYSPDINVPFSIASRHGSTFLNGAVDGTALTANLTPVAFPDLSATNVEIAPTFTGNIGKFRMWGDTTGDIGDIGIAEASAP